MAVTVRSISMFPREAESPYNLKVTEDVTVVFWVACVLFR